MKLWPTQERAVSETEAARRDGLRAVVLTSPTGGGKTAVAAELSKREFEAGGSVAMFTNRKLITSQSSKTLDRVGVSHGVMAAGYDAAMLQRVQVCSFQTIDSRVFGSGQWKLPRASLVLIDEAHSNTGDVSRAVIAHYLQAGSFIVGFTATPVGLGGLGYEKLITAGTKAELRQLGALVPCKVFSPDEPNLKGVKRTKVGEYEYKGVVKKIMETLVVANVFGYWKQLNPDGLPTILWAPGVEESRWFVQEWGRLGVRAAHIDGQTPNDEREQIFRDSEIGYVKIICSQGVLREGVDLPWLYHGILVQPCHNLSTYLQIVGRLLRAYDGKTHCILQDHSGTWHRHGSPNADRVWNLGDTDEKIAAERKRKFEAGQEREPIRCPKCGGIRLTGPKCPHCGHQHKHSVRLVRMGDGTLKEMRGNVNKRRQQVSDDERQWRSVLYAAANARHGMTLVQAKAWFHKKAGKPLPADLNGLPPADSQQWQWPVTDVYPWIKPRRKAS